ncbi:peptidylprolyl isomerase [Aureispira]|nr:peptidylprolyl isomerase [Aureispira sp.]
MKNSFFPLFIFFLYLTSCSTEHVSDNGTSDIENLLRQKISINTQYGEMILELFNETPKHRDNFLKLAKEGFYDSLLFHRVQPNFMVQGGDPESRGKVEPSKILGMGGAEKRIKAEISSKFIMRQGAICGFHRGTGHYPDKSSNGTQFMIIHGQPLKAYQINQISLENKINYSPEQVQLYEMYGGSPQLDGKYTIFGQVIKGINVLNKIVQVKTHRSLNPQLPDRPAEDIHMVVKILE